MVSMFDRTTAVARRDERTYDGEIDGGWDIGGAANGGYLIAIAARAMADAVGRPPLSLTAHYLSPGRPGPCRVEIDVVRAGRRTATVQARLSDASGADLLALLGTFGDQTPGGPAHVGAAPPDLPPYDECLSARPPVSGSRFGEYLATRVRPADLGFATGRPTGEPEIRGWFRFADVDPDIEPIDAYGLLLATDAFAPVCFNAGFPIGWAPTIELTVHVRGNPAPGPLRCRFSSRFLTDGMFEEDSEIWDAAGTLVGQSRQLALIPRPA
jgi:Thioesterase-like superfamily